MDMQAGAKKIVHFGNFVRREREIRNWSRSVFGKKIAGVTPDGRGFSEKRIFDIEKMPTPGGIRERTFVAMGRALGWETREAFDAAWRSMPVEPYPETEDRADESAAARLLAGEAVMLADLAAVAKERGVSLGELFREISRTWLEGHRQNPKPFRGVHTGLDAIRQPPASVHPPAALPASPGKPGRARRSAGHAGHNGK
jgi:hypothetical protein